MKNIKRIELGLQRYPDGGIAWTRFERSVSVTGCTIYSFGPFYITFIEEGGGE